MENSIVFTVENLIPYIHNELANHCREKTGYSIHGNVEIMWANPRYLEDFLNPLHYGVGSKAYRLAFNILHDAFLSLECETVNRNFRPYFRAEDNMVKTSENTIIKPGKYLAKHFPFSASALSSIVESMKAQFMGWSIIQGADIVTAYKNGPSSCMAENFKNYAFNDHPASLYAINDNVALAILGNKTNCLARSVLYKVMGTWYKSRKLYVAGYSRANIEDSFNEWCEENGIDTISRRACVSLIPNKEVCPYIDDFEYGYFSGDRIYLTNDSEDADFSTRSTSGEWERMDYNECARCGCRLEDDEANWINDEPYCDRCSNSCDRCGEYFTRGDENAYEGASGNIYCCWECAERADDIVECCENCGHEGSNQDIYYRDESHQVLCEDCHADTIGECDQCGDIHPLADEVLYKVPCLPNFVMCGSCQCEDADKCTYFECIFSAHYDEDVLEHGAVTRYTRMTINGRYYRRALI